MFAVVTVLVCAVLAADIVGSLIESEMPPTIARPSAIIQLPKPVVAPTPDGSALVERNMFCSTCGPIVIERGSNTPFQVDAILIATGIGANPVATVRVPATEVQGDFSVGDVIPGIGLVERIGFVSIDVVNQAGQRGTLSLLASGAATPGSSESAAAATQAPSAPSAWEGRIKKIDDTTFEVERALVRELVSGSMQTGGARISPIAKDGKLEGLRLFGVRPNSLAGTVGLANGDVLQAINNTRIENANTLIELYAQLETLSTVELAGTRKGKPLTLTLRLR